MSWAGADQINIEEYVPGVGTAGPPSLRTYPDALRAERPDLLSHLRWHFVYQRPQHLMRRFARITG